MKLTALSAISGLRTRWYDQTRGNAMMANRPIGEKVSVKRAEWVSAAALCLTLASLVFQLGVVWQAQQDQERRLVVVEADNRQLLQKVERIDANVLFLADRAREDREDRRLR